MKKVNEDLADLAMRAESDHEVQMARAELYKIAKYAIKLHDMLKGVSEREGLDGWVQSKITKSADYIGSVYHHLDYEMKFESVELGEADKKGTVTSVKDVKAPVAKPKKNGTVNKVSDARMTAKKKPGLAKDKYKESIEDRLAKAVEKHELSEKAKSKAQQKFMGMVHAAKKGEKPASKEVAKAAKGMSKKDAKDYASTKHKGLPNKVSKKD
jgi:hypothetical protein